MTKYIIKGASTHERIFATMDRERADERMRELRDEGKQFKLVTVVPR